MKARIFLLSAIGALSAAPVLAQVPNGGFEDWTTIGTYQDPTNWITFNELTTIQGVALSCEQGSPGAVGNDYAKLTTRNTPDDGVLPGIMGVGGGIDEYSGFPFTSRPGALTGQWQYDVMAGDSAFAAVQFTHWNAATQAEDIVGVGVLRVIGTVSSWQAFNIPIMYFTGSTPDSAFVTIGSSTYNNPVAGSFLKVDDLAFGDATGIAEAANSPAVRVFPSPANGLLNVVSGRPIADVDVLDMTGRILMQRSTDANSAKLNVAMLRTGRYLVRLRMKDGTRQVRSFVEQ